MDRSLLGSSVHGIFQARVLEWGAIAFSSFSLDALDDSYAYEFRGIVLVYFGNFQVLIASFTALPPFPSLQSLVEKSIK